VTFTTMMIGTLAIAGIPIFAGFFSKDEILFRTFLVNKPLWALAVATALLTAFYMFRLMSMTFLGPYRGPAWEHTTAAAAQVAAVHGVPHPADPRAHGQAHKDEHEVTHGPAGPHDDHAHAGRGLAHDDQGHGHGPWHGPHESPIPMTYPLMALAVGAIVAGFVGISPAICCTNEIEQFLEPSFTTQAAAAGIAGAPEAAAAPSPAESEGEAAEPHVSRAVELGLMLFSVLIAVLGIWTAYRFYVLAPEIAENLKQRWAGAHSLLYHKYYVDELYNAAVVQGTLVSSFALWAFDRRVIDGAVNGSGWLTVFASWVSSLIDKYVVDGAVNLVGRAAEESSFVFRRVQTGLIQNYALLMLFGVFAFVSIYLLVR
jgi:NADH-quinone oxidoreductase subunit L